MSKQHALRALFSATSVLAIACTNTLIFSDPETIPIVGHPPPPPPPPPPQIAPLPPARPPQRVEVQQDQIVIHDKIQFESDKATIKAESSELMNEIAAVVTTNAQIKRLSIEGHTDSTGGDKHNRELSTARAQAVLDYLVQQGVAPERLTSKGWGESKPIADNTTSTGREQNRRVEFVIVEQAALTRTYEIDPKTGEKREVATPPAAPSEPPALPPSVDPNEGTIL